MATISISSCSGIVTRNRAVLVRSEGINLKEFSNARVPLDAVKRLRAELEVAEPTQVVLMVVARAIWSKGVREFVEASALAAAWNCGEVRAGRAAGTGQPRCGPGGISAGAPLTAIPSSSCATTSWNSWPCPVSLCCRRTTGRECRASCWSAGFGKAGGDNHSVGCREVVDHGENGFLVPVKDPASLASAIRTLLDDRGLQARFGRQSYRKARDEFDETKIVRKILTDVYGLTA